MAGYLVRSLASNLPKFELSVWIVNRCFVSGLKPFKLDTYKALGRGSLRTYCTTKCPVTDDTTPGGLWAPDFTLPLQVDDHYIIRGEQQTTIDRRKLCPATVRQQVTQMPLAAMEEFSSKSVKKALTDEHRELVRLTWKQVTKPELHAGEKLFQNNYCESNIGKKGGKQTLYLGTGCRTRGHVTHELMHALGFFHEHTRPDRNKFVKILWDNIKKDQFDQFKIRTTYEATSFGQPYDFQSIMHYTNKEFSSNGEDTIQAIANPNMALGNINSMSAVDVLQVNLLYKCPEAQRKVVNYKVTVFTGNKFFAGTDARAFLELFGHTTGREKNSGEVELAGQPKSFEKGAVDTFNVISPVLGKLTKLTIRHNHAGFGAGWYLGKIRVKNSERQEDFLFVCNCWMEGTPNTRTLTPIESKYIPFL